MSGAGQTSMHAWQPPNNNLSSICLQFEKTEKKPAVIGWTAAAVGAFFLAEWLIHLPLLNVVSYRIMCHCLHMMETW